MKNLQLLLVSIIFISTLQLSAQLTIEQYTLDNGLTVILNPDPSQNDISAAVAVNTGSKNDPIDATGISHYLEHLLFKGTTELGTTNYEAEKIQLDSIYFLYDELGKTTDDEERGKIQQQINYHSVKASKYAMPNEFDKLLKSLGSTGVNATTSRDLTIYYNTLPSHQLPKWLDLYAHRFENPVFRSFQSELEVVYEEKNRAMDNMQRRIMTDFNQAFYKGHPYGDKGTLGTIEHLKNPSLNKMYDYYNTYYVANNMALIISGDFDSETIKPFIEKSFSALKSGELPNEKIEAPVPFQGKKLVKRRITPIKVGIYGFRTVPEFHEDEAALRVASYLLQNEAGTGLIDQMANNNDVMMAFSFIESLDETGNQVFILIPKVLIQSFGKIEKLLFEQLDKLKEGDFSDEFLTSIKNEIYLDNQSRIETPKSRMYLLAAAFRNNLSWQQMEAKLSAVEKVTKEDVQRVAKQYFGENYMAFQSRTGFPKKQKLKKPPFQPLQINQENESVYAKHFKDLEELQPKEKFINFEADLSIKPLGTNSKLFVTKNEINNVYELDFKFHMGELDHPNLKALEEALQHIHPEGKTQQEFVQQIGVLGSNLSFSSSNNSFTVKLRGLEKNLGKVLKELNDLMTAAKMEEGSLKVIYNSFKTDRKQEEENAVLIAQALAQYGLYGDRSPLKNRLGLKEIAKIKTEEYLSLWNEVIGKAVSIHFSGNMNSAELSELLASQLELNLDGSSNLPAQLMLTSRSENEIYVVNNKKIRQSHLFFVKNGGAFEENQLAKMNLFNQYFDGGFSGILTQEVREYRSLAYASTAKVKYTFGPKLENYFYTYIGTQADKTNASVDLTYNLIQDMPQKPERLEAVKTNVMLSNQSDYPNFRELSATVEELMYSGFQQDPAEIANGEYAKIAFSDLVEFYEKTIQNQPTFLGIHGDVKQFDLKELEKIGKVKMIKKEQVIAF